MRIPKLELTCPRCQKSVDGLNDRKTYACGSYIASGKPSNICKYLQGLKSEYLGPTLKGDSEIAWYLCREKDTLTKDPVTLYWDGSRLLSTLGGTEKDLNKYKDFLYLKVESRDILIERFKRTQHLVKEIKRLESLLNKFFLIPQERPLIPGFWVDVNFNEVLVKEEDLKKPYEEGPYMLLMYLPQTE